MMYNIIFWTITAAILIGCGLVLYNVVYKKHRKIVYFHGKDTYGSKIRNHLTPLCNIISLINSNKK